MAIRIGLVGYGDGGRLYHAPYIQASEACDLVGVVVRNPERVRQAQEDLPGVAVFASLRDLLDAGVDAVTISTPPETRRDLVLEAVARGVSVLADKPFGPSAEAAQELVDAANDAGVVLNVFHNRRYDTDVVTARDVIAGGQLGEVTRLDLRFDLDEARTLEAGPTGGLLRDLGSHVVDQALSLMGPAVSVTAYMDYVDLPAGRTDSGFVINIAHASGGHSHVSSSKINCLVSKELRVHGTLGSYVSDFTDVQAAAIKCGERPAGRRSEWGLEAESRWGTLAVVGADPVRLPSSHGDYTVLYDEFAAAVENGGAGPVPGEQGVAVLRVLDAARQSADEGRTVTV
ncbi:Gfo/Idh/MocA family protein [Tessaracoccus caeni]|uniref:Gfo/Idh/MocA family protein n=1 Tax=Tessaracoccus caeni TaxID=3031239 RepID=UPI0023D9F933|nr:Gfo/Idh/MocA family oxidoreductase [Tessaracoccus caeni]MDF1487453.1 Gfo/Idh/MocA family oxidoreductase [Tessaracoccus caeni]